MEGKPMSAKEIDDASVIQQLNRILELELAGVVRYTQGGQKMTNENDRSLRASEEAVRESEERLRAILNTAADAIVNIDRGGTITDVNPAGGSRSGCSSSTRPSGCSPASAWP